MALQGSIIWERSLSKNTPPSGGHPVMVRMKVVSQGECTSNSYKRQEDSHGVSRLIFGGLVVGKTTLMI